MIKAPAPYPFVGSYALFADPLEPRPIVNGKPGQPQLHLVRITARASAFFAESGCEEWRAVASIAFPLRENVASGSRTVELSELIDPTPLTDLEARTVADVQRHLKDRPRLTKAQRQMKADADVLEARARMATLAAALLERLAKRQAAVGTRRAA